MEELREESADFEQALLTLDRVEAERILESLRLPALDVVEGLVVPALQRIGKGWEEGSVALSQVYMCGKICEVLVDRILPPCAPARKDLPRMALATLEDQHSLGKKIVYATMRASGFELRDYGNGLTADEVAGRAAKDGIEILLLSMLMIRSALRVKDVRALLDGHGAGTKILVGGAPFRFDDELWKTVKADAVCKTASEAPGAVRMLWGGAKR